MEKSCGSSLEPSCLRHSSLGTLEERPSDNFKFWHHLTLMCMKGKENSTQLSPSATTIMRCGRKRQLYIIDKHSWPKIWLYNSPPWYLIPQKCYHLYLIFVSRKDSLEQKYLLESKKKCNENNLQELATFTNQEAGSQHVWCHVEHSWASKQKGRVRKGFNWCSALFAVCSVTCRMPTVSNAEINFKSFLYTLF